MAGNRHGRGSSAEGSAPETKISAFPAPMKTKESFFSTEKTAESEKETALPRPPSFSSDTPQNSDARAAAPGGTTYHPYHVLQEGGDAAANSSACDARVAREVEAALSGSEEDSATPTEWWRFVAIGVLVCLSGLFSGLTLGLLSLDIVGLEIVIASGTEQEARYARKIKPLRAQGNLLLCTLLLGNTCVNATLAILFADLTSGLIGLLVSTVTIVIFGEITPQATCSRYSLMIGAYSTPLVWIFLVLLYPAAWPISRVLDLVLGEEVGTIYSKNMLKKMIEIHADHPEISNLQHGDAQVVVGALDFATKQVRSIMTPLDDVFSLDMDQRLDRETLEDILDHGHSRIPVREGDTQKVHRILIVKDLALLNPDDGLPVRMIIDDYGRPAHRVFEDATLGELLNFFKKKRIHLAIVTKVVDDGPGDPYYVNTGIVTLEDLFEEIIQDEIVDETDLYIDVGAGDKVRNDGREVNYAGARTSFRKRKLATSISNEQAKAVCSYLANQVSEFAADKISAEVLSRLILQQKLGLFKAPSPPERLAIYTRGVPSPNFTLILDGRVNIEVGADGFRSEAGPWSMLGRGALTEDTFVPDFTATVTEDIKLLVISYREYAAAIKATKISTAGPDHLSSLKGVGEVVTNSPGTVLNNMREQKRAEDRRMSDMIAAVEANDGVVVAVSPAPTGMGQAGDPGAVPPIVGIPPPAEITPARALRQGEQSRKGQGADSYTYSYSYTASSSMSSASSDDDELRARKKEARRLDKQRRLARGKERMHQKKKNAKVVTVLELPQQQQQPGSVPAAQPPILAPAVLAARQSATSASSSASSEDFFDAPDA